MKKALFLFLLILTQIGCTSDDELNNSDTYYVEKAQILAEESGMRFEYTNLSAMTKAEYEKVEQLILLVNKQFENGIELKYTESLDGVVTFSNVPFNSSPRIKTREEGMTAQLDNINFKVSPTVTNGKCTFSYSATSDSYNIVSVVKDEETITNENGVAKMSTTVRVVCKVGGGYMHMSYKIEGSYTLESGSGSISVKK